MRHKPDEVLELIESRREGELVGAYETQSVDFKGAPYVLDKPGEKWELAKDVALMANGGGGLIAIGFPTRMDPDRAEERVEDARPIPGELIDLKRIHDTVNRWVYPVPLVEVIRHPRDEKKAFCTIKVEPVDGIPEYLVTRMPTEDGKYSAHSIGLPRRRGTQTVWATASEISHRLAGDGRAPVDARDVLWPLVERPEFDTDSLVDEVEALMGAEGRALLYLVGFPSTPVDAPIAGFYSPEGALGALQTSYELRPSGFGLAYRHEVDRDAAGRLIALDDERAFLAQPDGVAIGVLAAGPHFLTRSGGASDPVEPIRRRINPVVVTEWTYLFTKFVTDHLAKVNSVPWRLGIGLRGAVSRPWSLAAVQVRWEQQKDSLILPDARPSGPDDWRTDIPSQSDPELDAFALLERMYRNFGVEFDQLGLSEGERVPSHVLEQLG